jgi:hypothetical protein
MRTFLFRHALSCSMKVDFAQKSRGIDALPLAAGAIES